MRSTLGYPKFYALPSCFLGYGVLNQTLQITFYLRMKLREELKYPPVSVWKFPGVLYLDPQVNYVHPLWTYFDPGWTYLGHSKFDHIWDIG